MTKKERVLKLRELLDKAYPDVKCSLNYTTPLEMLIATQMSAQCTDARVNIITETLFKKYRNAEDFANADYDELCEDIKSAGFYRNKAPERAEKQQTLYLAIYSVSLLLWLIHTVSGLQSV